MGANQERFKPYLFADQALDELVSSMSPPGGELADAVARLRAGDPADAELILASAMLARPDEVGGWHHLLLAGARTRRANTAGAVAALRNAAASTDTRVQLWSWTALRALGEAATDARVLGVIVEVEVGKGVDTLAAYADGAARYLLHTGARVVWDAPDARLRAEVKGVIDAAQTVDAAPGRADGPLGPAQVRYTLLAATGPRSVEEPLAEATGASSPRAALFGAATALLEKILVLAKW